MLRTTITTAFIDMRPLQKDVEDEDEEEEEEK